MSVANQEFLNKYLLAKNMLVQAFLQIFLDPAFQQACEPDICDKNIMSGVNCSVLNILCNIIDCLSTVLCAGTYCAFVWIAMSIVCLYCLLVWLRLRV